MRSCLHGATLRHRGKHALSWRQQETLLCVRFCNCCSTHYSPLVPPRLYVGDSWLRNRNKILVDFRRFRIFKIPCWDRIFGSVGFPIDDDSSRASPPQTGLRVCDTSHIDDEGRQLSRSLPRFVCFVLRVGFFIFLPIVIVIGIHSRTLQCKFNYRVIGSLGAPSWQPVHGTYKMRFKNAVGTFPLLKVETWNLKKLQKIDEAPSSHHKHSHDGPQPLAVALQVCAMESAFSFRHFSVRGANTSKLVVSPPRCLRLLW